MLPRPTDAVAAGFRGVADVGAGDDDTELDEGVPAGLAAAPAFSAGA
jgi:hypothetical protein